MLVCESGIRTVLMRTATVLGPGGGALAKLLRVFNLGFGGTFGKGDQWMSWIHRDDLVWMYLRAVEDASISGPLIAASPVPVRSAEFTATLGRLLDRPAWLRIPGALLRLAIGGAASVGLSSQFCVPRKVMDAGFRWRFPGLEGALSDAVASTPYPQPEAS